MAIVAVLIPLGLLAVLVALGRYEELMLPPLAEDPEGPTARPWPAGRRSAAGRPFSAEGPPDLRRRPSPRCRPAMFGATSKRA